MLQGVASAQGPWMWAAVTLTGILVIAMPEKRIPVLDGDKVRTMLDDWAVVLTPV